MTPLVEIQPKAGSSNQDPLKKIEMNLTDGVNTVRAEALGRVAERIANLVKDCKNQEHIGQLAMVDFTLERREGQTREDGSKSSVQTVYGPILAALYHADSSDGFLPAV